VNKIRKTSQSKHEFAFYIEDASSLIGSLEVGSEFRVDDRTICHRMDHVLRLSTDDTFFIFDREIHIKLQLQYTEKKRYITGIIQEKKKNIILKPTIEFWLPLLKRENFEAALYAIVELGAQSIKPIITEKSQHKFDTQKALARYQKIIISAAEQSKNFAFPRLENQIDLKDLATQKKYNNYNKIYFDPEGNSLFDMISQIKSTTYDKLILMVGPEGDLTKNEKIYLQENGFIFCKLTPTVLRAFQAVTVGLGAFRSLF